jgi:hypothetical protein
VEYLKGLEPVREERYKKEAFLEFMGLPNLPKYCR